MQACPQAAAAVLGEACLRRTRAGLGFPPRPLREVRLPLELAPGQAAGCRAVLARAFEVLADPHPPRHSGHRAAQLRTIAAELRRVRLAPILAWDRKERASREVECGH